jgi:hypothetical protein
MGKKVVLFVGSALLTLISCGGGGGGGGASITSTNMVPEKQSIYNWLVLIYMDGDNSLSSYTDADLNELSSVIYDPRVKVVILRDTYGDNGGEIWETINGALSKVENVPEPNMGKPATLEQFVINYANQYPSKNIALIMWDHGLAWRALIPPSSSYRLAAIDETNNDTLYMYEFRQALQNIKSSGININLIGFDECLMGNLEVFYDVSVNTDYVVASENLEPGEGWDYSLVMDKLNQNPDIDAYTFGKYIVDSYKEAYENSYCTTNNCTMTLASVNNTNTLVDAINQISLEYLKNSNSLKNIFSNIRNNLPEIYDNLVDVYNFAKGLEGKLNSTAPYEIVSTINNLYKYTNNAQFMGISIYFPPDKYQTDISYFCSSPTVCEGYYNPFTETYWDDFLKSFLGF